MLSVAGLLMKFHSDKQIRAWCKRRGIEENALFLEENLTRLKEFLL